MRLLRAEVLKVRTAPRTTLGLLLGLLAIVVLGSVATTSEASGDNRDELLAWDLLSVASIAPVFGLILGILVVTWEYRHGTVTQTFLATPRRERVMGAKIAVALAAGTALAVLAVATALFVSRVWMPFEFQRDQAELAGRIVLAGALWCVLGAGLGALLQSQIGSLISAFLWIFIVEELVAWQIPTIGDYLPRHALDRFQGQGGVEASPSGVAVHPYDLWFAGLLIAAYAAGAALLGLVSAVRRDVP